MVRSWILGSVNKELAESFVYCSTARIMWEEMKERFSEINSPQVYKIQRDIASMQQGNINLASYFNRLKKLWEDYNNLRPLPHWDNGGCKCGVTKKLIEMDGSMKTIQFLMGLNEVFDTIRNQILIKEPLPNVNKAYSMLQNVEFQR